MSEVPGTDGGGVVRTVRWVVGCVLGLAVFALAWGLIEPYTISVERYEVELERLPEAWEGRHVAVVTDFQVGMWLDNTWTVDRVIRRLAEERPSLVLILGDFIYHGGEDASRRIDTVVELIEPLSAADVPVYAVLGNHDYSVASYEDPSVDEARARALRAALDGAGAQVLQNEAVPVQPYAEADGENGQAEALYLVGIGARMPRKAQPEAAVQNVPPGAARLVIMHNPGTFANVPARAAPLTVAGHTHGGQIRIPFTPAWSWVTYLKDDQIHVDGWIRDYGEPGNRLYVNRGIGFSKVPLRINCPPEITIFTLHKPEP